ncbi:hypothetical protein C5167_017120 [Papaver somniferum]|uniref:IBH1-like N-terminal domain-containing protein n=1 Tax=Papaver somniferum TaxID=3469 RepID=A0A4Y7IMK7_PAPSO|nr:hypothetical protein C5167_017120 [Papaver somniferum]
MAISFCVSRLNFFGPPDSDIFPLEDGVELDLKCHLEAPLNLARSSGSGFCCQIVWLIVFINGFIIYNLKSWDKALRHVRRNNNDSNDNSSSSSSNTDQSSNSNTTSSLSTAKNGRAIREAADKALAVAAKGRTRWSRAILTNRLQLKFKKKKPKVVTCRSQKRSFDVYQLKDKKKLQPLQRKVKVLGRIVPGCKKLSFPVLLEETTDYIAALEMQVRTMTALTQLLSLAGSSSSSSPASTNHVEDHSL